MHKVFIDGSAGTTGLKIQEYLNARRDIEIIKIQEKYRKNNEYRLNMMAESDITFLCLPDNASLEIAEFIPESAKVIDTATCHRTTKNWTYGMPELTKDQSKIITKSSRVANPGCHASGFILGIKPLIASGILNKDSPLSVTSLTGYSGGGKTMINQYEKHFNKKLEGGSIYGLTQNHKHLSEMTMMTGMNKTPTFIPIVVNSFSGMAVTIPLHKEFLTNDYSLQDIQDVYNEYYSKCPLIDVSKELLTEGFIYSNEFSNLNKAKVFIYGNNDRPVITVLFDNLGKGASGSAIQNMNLMLGIKQTRGLI